MLHYGSSQRLIRKLLLPGLELHRAFAPAYPILSRPRVFPYTLLQQESVFSTMPKRKSSAALAQPSPLPLPDMPLQAPVVEDGPPLPKRRASARKVSQTKASMNPGQNPNVLDGPQAFRASPDADTKDERMDLGALMDVDTVVEEKDDSLPSLVTNGDSDSPLSDMSEMNSPVEAEAPPVQVPKKGGKAKSASTAPDDKPAAPAKAKKEAATAPQFLDPEADGEEEADEEEIKEALSRPPPVNSDYLPLPWTGRLGYVSCQKPAAPDSY